MNDRQKDVLIRAGKTFVQALIATAMTQLIAVLGAGAKLEMKSLLVTVGLPALAAGISAMQNVLFPPTKTPDEENDHTDIVDNGDEHRGNE